MNTRKFRQTLAHFVRAEDGTSMTEFIVFLPIWIFVFVAIVNLGQVGIVGTQVQLRAQKALWAQVIPQTQAFDGNHVSAPVAGGFTVADYGRVAGISGNDQSGNDGFEALATTAGLIAFGHFGESCEKSFIPASFALPSNLRFKCMAEDVIVSPSELDRYPYRITSDSTADNVQGLFNSFSGGGSTASAVVGVVAGLFAATGTVQALGAGIRYGSDFADENATQGLASTWSTVNAGAHYDAIAAPRALSNPDDLLGEATMAPFAIAYLMFKADPEYIDFLQYGKDNWDGDQENNSMTPGSDCTTNADGTADNCGDADAGVTAECNARKAADPYDPSCSDDPDANPPVVCASKPSWWDDCN